MCYHLSFASEIESIYALLPELDRGQLDIHFEGTFIKVAQTLPNWPLIVNDNKIRVVKAEWGVFPEKLKDQGPTAIIAGRKKLVNARSENIFKRWYTWYDIRGSRCLIPATGFYEFRDVGWKTKVPYHISVKGQTIFFIAGLWNYAPIPNVETGEARITFTLITRPANPVLKKIHNSGDNPYRMPLILSSELYREWLQLDLSGDDMKKIMDFEFPEVDLEFWPVKSLYRAQPHDPKVAAPVEYEGLPEL